jgi:DNA-binding transcriptional LysR family regulator
MLKARVHDRGNVDHGKTRDLESGTPNTEANVPTDLLRTFVSISELGSFTKAGRLYRLTQPAISAQMKRLEHIVGADLFERMAPGIRLTSRGLEVLKFARRILSINDQILGYSQSQSAPPIRIGVSHIFAHRVLQEPVFAPAMRATNARLQIFCDNSENLLQSIRSGYLEIACLIGDEPEVAGALCSWTESLVRVRAPNIVVRDQEPVPLISSPNRVLPDRIAIQALTKANRRYEITMSSDDRNARHAAARLGLGYLAMPRRSIPSALVVDEHGGLPRLRSMAAGIVTREGVDPEELSALIAVLEAAVYGAPSVGVRGP